MRMYLHLSCLVALALTFFIAGKVQAGCPLPRVVAPISLATPTIKGAEIDCRQPLPPPPRRPPPPQNTWRNNGIISMNINQNGVPMISNLSVLGTPLMSFDNVGAGLQMTGRSSLGNAYNPTQAGDCAQDPSTLLGLNTTWGENGIGIPASYGVQLRVQPRNYNQSGPTCPGPGALLPYEFDFAATLGDGSHFPEQGMIMDMSVTRQASSQVLQKGSSEFPSIYPLVDVLPYAFWSPDGVNFHGYAINVGGVMTNDIRQWPYGVNYGLTGRALMICTSTQTMCLAIYSHTTTSLILSHRQGTAYDLALMTMVMAPGYGAIDDFNTHSGTKILAVGTPGTIQEVIRAAESNVKDWGDL